MKLLTEELKNQLPPLYSQEQNSDPTVICKFFTPWSSWTWYAYEYSPEEGLLFGKVYSELCPEGEIGYFSLAELESVQGPMGLKVERDIHFKPKKLSECKG
jgi:Protein of unknown function (DUF2958)